MGGLVWRHVLQFGQVADKFREHMHFLLDSSSFTVWVLVEVAQNMGTLL